MTILQLFQETFSDPSMYGYMGVGSGIGSVAGAIGMKLIDKVLNKKKETVDMTAVINQQVRTLFDNGEFKDKIIEELQSWACFRDPCKIRLNGAGEIQKHKTAKKDEN